LAYDFWQDLRHANRRHAAHWAVHDLGRRAAVALFLLLRLKLPH
jgi:hypothetical protein